MGHSLLSIIRLFLKFKLWTVPNLLYSPLKQVIGQFVNRNENDDNFHRKDLIFVLILSQMLIVFIMENLGISSSWNLWNC